MSDGTRSPAGLVEGRTRRRTALGAVLGGSSPGRRQEGGQVDKEGISRDRVRIPARGVRAVPVAELDTEHVSQFRTAVVEQRGFGDPWGDRFCGRCGVRDLLPASRQLCGQRQSPGISMPLGRVPAMSPPELCLCGKQWSHGR
jgi:hypothetical protein